MLTEHYIKILKHLEYLKEDTMMRINGETTPGGNLENITYKTVYPLAEVKPFSLNDYIVFHFAYEGALPLYKEKDSKYLSMIRHYYYRSTLDAYNFTKYQCLFSEAVLYIQHWFNDLRMRDLDNRSRKYIIDAIRHTGLIKDDSWNRLSIYEEGRLHNKENMVLVYLLEKENYIDFLIELNRDGDTFKVHPDMGIKDKILKDYEKQKALENNYYSSLKTEPDSDQFWS